MNLIYLCLFFLFISPFYEHALKSMFRYNFKWHWASVVGIGIVITCLSWFVWRPLGNALTWEFVWSSSVLAFLCALWGMARHGEWLLKEQINTRQMLQKARTRVLELSTENTRLEVERDNLKDERQELKEEILPALERIEQNQNDETCKLNLEALGLAEVLRWQLWSEEKIEKNN